jgi:hypothetical protein
MNDYETFKDLYTVTPYLRQIGLTPNDKVISIPDYCEASLYLMNQKGWTEYTDPWVNNLQTLYYNIDSTRIETSISKGAKYLIVNGIEEIFKNKDLQKYCKNLKGHYNNVLIFDLVNPGNNFVLNERTFIEKRECDAEKVTADMANFIGNPDSLLFQFGVTQSADFAHSGQFSSRLNEELQYGMTHIIRNVKYAENIIITVWRKNTGKAQGTIIAAGGSYYNSDAKVAEQGDDGWEKLSLDLLVPSDLDGKGMSIYLFNHQKDPAYFDDLEINRYSSVMK